MKVYLKANEFLKEHEIPDNQIGEKIYLYTAQRITAFREGESVKDFPTGPLKVTTFTYRGWFWDPLLEVKKHWYESEIW